MRDVCALDRGVRRLVAVISLGLAAVGIWQAGLALREAAVYQAEVREAASFWQEFRMRLEDERENRANVRVQLERSLDDVIADLESREGMVRLTKSERFEIYRSVAETDKLGGLDSARPLEWQFPALGAALRADLKAAGQYPGDTEILTALRWYFQAAGREDPPWQFTWWPSQPAWWRWPLPVVTLMGLVFSAGLALIPWYLFYAARWIVLGFLPADGTTHRRVVPVPSDPHPPVTIEAGISDSRQEQSASSSRSLPQDVAVASGDAHCLYGTSELPSEHVLPDTREDRSGSKGSKRSVRFFVKLVLFTLGCMQLARALVYFVIAQDVKAAWGTAMIAAIWFGIALALDLWWRPKDTPSRSTGSTRC